MASREEEKYRMNTIPMLGVVKNNAILKNIFIMNNNCKEHTVIVGRHPDCNIVVTHPSISRFHLQIRSKPFSRVLSLLDLSSVHGTWVNGRKLQPGGSVDLKQGDTFTLGVSTRVYHLHWVPLTFSQFNLVHQDQEQIVKDVSFCTVGNEEIPSMDSIPRCDNSNPPDVNLELVSEKEIPLLQGMVSLCFDEERNNHLKDERFGVLNGGSPFGAETSRFSANSVIDCQRRVLAPPYLQSVDEVDNKEKKQACPEVEMPGETNLFCTLREYLTENICLPVVEAVQGIKMQQLPDTLKQEASFEENGSNSVTDIDPASFDEKLDAAVPVMPQDSEFGCTITDNDKVEDVLTTGASICNSENTCLIVREAIPESQFRQVKSVEEVSVDSLSDGETQDKCIEEYKSKLQDLSVKSFPMQGHSLDEIDEDIGSRCTCIKNTVFASSDENGVASMTAVPKDSEFGCILGDNDRIEDILTSGTRIFNPENTSFLVGNCSVPQEAVSKVADQKKNQSLQSLIAVAGSSELEIPECRVEAKESDEYCHEQGLPLDERVEDIVNNCTGSIRPVPVLVESVNCPVPQEADSKITNNKENQTPQSLIVMAGCSEMEILESFVEATECAKHCHEQGHPLDERVEDIGNNCTGSICPISVMVESVNSPLPHESDLKITNKKENQTPQSPVALAGCSEMEVLESHLEATEKSSTIGNIWSRRGKAASAPQARTTKSRLMSKINVDTGVEMGNEKDVMIKSMQKELFSVLDDEAEEIFTPNKENFSPNTLHFRFMRKKGKLEGIKHSESQRSHNPKANFNFSPNICSDEGISAISNKDNQTLKVAQEQKSRRKPLECRMNLAQEQDIMDMKRNRVERIPFQSLTNSGGKRNSRTSGPVSAAKIVGTSNCGQVSDKCTKPSHISGGQNRSWVMVVDTASLLNKESRKALQLLQGLKGTRLIIPKLVIRELECMKQRQFRIFRRISQASLALEWIEECMENTKWWIDIQSSMEEHRLIAPTPPASPQTQFVEESWTFPGPSSSKEIASTTVEDHILDCALLYRRKENDGQLVLLSDDITLKIKSMAEGLLCETVHEFRQSLVNPFSKRFMWPNSSARGLTWSCQDDVVLREKYCGLPSKAGLKFITQQFSYF